MRVLHVVPALGAVYGGPSKIVPAIAGTLARLGLAVDVATTDADGQGRLAEADLDATMRPARSYVFRHHCPTFLTCSVGLAKWLMKYVPEYDLVHVHSVFNFPATVACRIASRTKTPYVLTPHGMLEPWCLRYKGWKKKPYLALVERANLRRATALHAVVRSEAIQFRAIGVATPSFVLPNGVHIAECQGHTPAALITERYPQLRAKRVVGYLGRLDPKKGIDVLIRGFASLLRSEPSTRDVVLVIAGPDLIGYRAELEELVERARIGDRIVFTGMLTGAHKQAFLEAAAVCVLPSRSDVLGVAALEALAASRPLVISVECAFPEVEERGAGIVVNPEEGEIASALARILADEELRRDMGRRGRRLVAESYVWDRICQRLIAVYEDILRGTRLADAWVANS